MILVRLAGLAFSILMTTSACGDLAGEGEVSWDMALPRWDFSFSGLDLGPCGTARFKVEQEPRFWTCGANSIPARRAYYPTSLWADVNTGYGIVAAKFGQASGYDAQYKVTLGSGNADVLVQKVWVMSRSHGSGGVNCDLDHISYAFTAEVYEMFELPAYDMHSWPHGCGTWSRSNVVGTSYLFNRQRLEGIVGQLPTFSGLDGASNSANLSLLLSDEQFGKLEAAIAAQVGCWASDFWIDYSVDLCQPSSYDLLVGWLDMDGLHREDYLQ